MPRAYLVVLVVEGGGGEGEGREGKGREGKGGSRERGRRGRGRGGKKEGSYCCTETQHCNKTLGTECSKNSGHTPRNINNYTTGGHSKPIGELRVQ